ncbi:MAG: hypothetical protein CVU78_02530 [Elusimicrobia bacterium HGW-Elusimicrobia-2]|nr:MAG: hypothetical protein CVU78_02530 [Elusimicrobia bacterium HGW-Elusimicrobia-2]
MKRLYEELLSNHFKKDKQIAFVLGPRQVGKTTTCRAFEKNHSYFNWDDEKTRRLILKGQDALAEEIGANKSTVVIFDELHKYPEWKNFIKGFYDVYAKDNFQVIVTGSANFNIHRKGADSLMGRYFLYRMHPLTIGEIVHKTYSENEIRKPKNISDAVFKSLLRYGGFPEPFLKNDVKFFNKWKGLRKQLLFREDLRDLTRINEVGQVEVLAELIQLNAAQQCNYSSYSKKLRASENSVRSWIAALESLYYCFRIKPWSKNISKALTKEPKIYLWDWSSVDDEGARNENFVASHLLKSVHWWSDNGFGDYDLFYLRTFEKREIDFLVTKDKKPWFLVEVKTKEEKLNKNLSYFQEKTKAAYAFQVVFNKEFVDKDCFGTHYPIVVPARTFLSQLI